MEINTEKKKRGRGRPQTRLAGPNQREFRKEIAAFLLSRPENVPAYRAYMAGIELAMLAAISDYRVLFQEDWITVDAAAFTIAMKYNLPLQSIVWERAMQAARAMNAPTADEI